MSNEWLMILDNAGDNGSFFEDDPDGGPHEGSLPHKAHGAILITSRNKTATTNLVGGHGDIVEVEPMGEEDALALLRTRVPFGETSLAEAKKLVQGLERISLVITHAAAYITTTTDTTISTYV